MTHQLRSANKSLAAVLSAALLTPAAAFGGPVAPPPDTGDSSRTLDQPVVVAPSPDTGDSSRTLDQPVIVAPAPDVADSSRTAYGPATYVVRSPDAGDQTRRVGGSPTFVSVPAADGFDWGDAGIGAGLGTGLLLAAFGASVIMQRRTRTA